MITEYHFSVSDGGVDAWLLHSEITVAVGKEPAGIEVKGTNCYVRMPGDYSASDQATMTDVISAHGVVTLEAAKVKKCWEIDSRTAELISVGFVYSNETFSLSLQAQLKLAGTHEVKDYQALTYPIIWNNIDDTGTVVIASAAELDAFYLAALATIRGHLDAGTVLKDQVRAATTVAEVEAIGDTR